MTGAASPRPTGEAAAAVAICADGELAEAVCRCLAVRGLRARPVGPDQASAVIAAGTVVGWALAELPDPTVAARVAIAATAAAQAGRPLVLLLPPARVTGPGARERAAALAHLRAAGAAIVHDPDPWIEALLLVALFGPPRGPRVAMIADDTSLVAVATAAAAAEAAQLGARAHELMADPDAPTDVVLHDAALAPPASIGPDRSRPLAVPVFARAELADDRPALHGVRAALGAALAVGRAMERITAGLGPAPSARPRDLTVDAARVERQLARIGSWDRRVGDHECKVLLAAYGVPVIRQAVATTPSAATRIAKKVGFPVELKPYGNEVATERAGCPIARAITTASEVRRGMATVLTAAPPAAVSAAAPSGGDGAVIVRETPPSGRPAHARFERVAGLGWIVVLEVPGAAEVLAAPCPLRPLDATGLAAMVAATRLGDAEPDRAALADLLRRASHLVVDHADRIGALELSAVVGGPRTLVVDCVIELASS